MSLAMTQGLSTEQAPPLSVPFAYFLSAPLALVAAGIVIAMRGESLFVSKWSPGTIAVTHLGTLGFVGSVMLGSLYQMVPVVAGASVPVIRLAHVVHALFTVGVIGLVAGAWTASGVWQWIGIAGLVSSLTLFLVPVMIALARAPVRTGTVAGIALAVLALPAAGFLGAHQLWAYLHGTLPDNRADWLSAHLTLGLIAWVGGLITAVSWQVIPMFYLTPGFPREVVRTSLVGLALTLLLVPVALAVPGFDIPVAASPGVLIVWLLQPAMALILLAHRKRGRPDPSLTFWKTGLVLAFVTLTTITVAIIFDDARWSVVTGWLAIFGWAGLIVHGMLTRIVPFLIWFHRFAALAGLAPVPPMRRLLPDRWARTGYWFHLSAVAVGTAAVFFPLGAFARLAGIALTVSGLTLLVAMIRALRHPVPEVSV